MSNKLNSNIQKLPASTIKKIKRLIFLIDRDSNPTIPLNFEIMFSQKDEGTVILSGEEARQYKNCLNLLISRVSDEEVSANSIGKLLQNAILYSLDIEEKRRDITFDERFDESINDLTKSLNMPKWTFDIYYPLSGLSIEGLPIKIGDIEICLFDENCLNDFHKIVFPKDNSDINELQKQSQWEWFNYSENLGKPIAKLEIVAFDSDAALSLAKKKIIYIIDIINFFGSMVDYQSGYISLPGENVTTTIDIPIICNKENPYVTTNRKIVGPPTLFSLKALEENENRKAFGFSEVLFLLSKDKNEVEEGLLTAIQWAGKALVNEKREMAFLMFAISLDSLLIPEEYTNSIGKKMGKRISNLIGMNEKRKSEIINEWAKLYSVRSRIVHEGCFEVTDKDLQSIRYYSVVCILHFLKDKIIASFTNMDELIQWLENPTT